MRFTWLLALTMACSDGGTDTGSETDTSESDTGMTPDNYNLVAFTPVLAPDTGERVVNIQLAEAMDRVELPDTATELAIGDGLHLTVAAGDLEPPPFIDPATEIVAKDVTDIAMPVELQGTVKAMWYLDPFDFHASSDLAIRVDDNFGEPASGKRFELWVASYEEYWWLPLGEVTKDSDDMWALSTGGLGLISTVILLETDVDGQDTRPAITTGDATIKGVVTLPDGSPAEGVTVNYCRIQCLTVYAAADGSYEFTNLEAGPGSLEILP